jgi:hypothetical protein
MGIAVRCADGWYCFEYARGGASGISGSNSSSKSSASNSRVTIVKSAPPGKTIKIGYTQQGLGDIEKYARECGWNGSKYDVTSNNCRKFARELASFMGLEDEFDENTKGYDFTGK